MATSKKQNIDQEPLNNVVDNAASVNVFECDDIEGLSKALKENLNKKEDYSSFSPKNLAKELATGLLYGLCIGVAMQAVGYAWNKVFGKDQ